MKKNIARYPFFSTSYIGKPMPELVTSWTKMDNLSPMPGETQGLDATSLASLIAGSIAATASLAKLMGEQEFLSVFHEGQKDHMHVSVVGQRVILVVMFDQRSSLGLIRLRV
jgi:hypothetical protein